ncbi:hypothetical protein ACH4E8_11610 [Streptomyces sp. NPDC017979]|uniref:hypothetical protein n=1 Tax=Streptomyces sp. NPDC017979 TaxID=3365024 RepID=UPI00378DB36A
MDLKVIARSKPLPGVPDVVYTADFEMHLQATTDPHTSDIKTWLEMTPIYNTFPAVDKAVIFGSDAPDAFIDIMCNSDGCNNGAGAKPIDFLGALSWKGGMNGIEPNDTHVSTGTSNHTWNGKVNGTGARDVDLSKALPMYFVTLPVPGVDPPPAPDGRKREWVSSTGPARAPDLTVRCEKVSSYGAPGCVLSQYVPRPRSTRRTTRPPRPMPGWCRTGPPRRGWASPRTIRSSTTRRSHVQPAAGTRGSPAMWSARSTKAKDPAGTYRRRPSSTTHGPDRGSQGRQRQRAP